MKRYSANTSLWSDTAQDIQSWEALDGTMTADVVVIGGGFTGISAAYHLASSGASVVVLEANTIGFGGSGRNVGLVNAGLWTPPDQVENKLGQAAGQRLNAELAVAPELVFNLINDLQIRCEATRQGTLHCAHSSSGLRDLEARFVQQVARNAPVELLDSLETARRTGSNAYHGALLDTRAGTIQPLAYLQGLAQAASLQGAQIFEHSSATDVMQSGTGWTVKTKAGVVKAARLIQATNAYGVDGASQNAIIPAHYFQLATAPLPQALRDEILCGGEGCWDTAMVMSSFRMDTAGRMIFGGLGDLNGFGGSTHEAWARRSLAVVFPKLAAIPFVQSWTGRIAMTSAYLPRVERRGTNGISIFGYSGRGIAPGTMFGQAATNWAMGQDTFPIAICHPKPEPAATLKNIYFETGATLTHMIKARRAVKPKRVPQS